VSAPRLIALCELLKRSRSDFLKGIAAEDAERMVARVIAVDKDGRPPARLAQAILPEFANCKKRDGYRFEPTVDVEDLTEAIALVRSARVHLVALNRTIDECRTDRDLLTRLLS
jgi:hypothetical protein